MGGADDWVGIELEIYSNPMRNALAAIDSHSLSLQSSYLSGSRAVSRLIQGCANSAQFGLRGILGAWAPTPAAAASV